MACLAIPPEAYEGVMVRISEANESISPLTCHDTKLRERLAKPIHPPGGHFKLRLEHARQSS